MLDRIDLIKIKPILQDLIDIADHHMESMISAWEGQVGDHKRLISILEATLAWTRLQKQLIEYQRAIKEAEPIITESNDRCHPR